jgi:hypothetical protein
MPDTEYQILDLSAVAGGGNVIPESPKGISGI